MKRSLHSVQFFRFVAASLVVLFHTVGAIRKYYPGDVPAKLSYFAGIGAAGVHIFFVISGFIMVFATYSPLGPRLAPMEFLARRALRIYPIYLVYASIYILFYYQTTGAVHSSGLEIAESLMLLPGYSSYMIGPGWTLSYELYFYLCFAFVLFSSMPKGLIGLSLFFLVSCVLGMLSVNDPTFHVLTNPLLLEFLFGAWVAWCTLSATDVSSKLAVASLILGIAGFLGGLIFGYSRGPSLVVWGLPSVLLLFGAIFLELNGRLPRIIKDLSFLGDSSYSLYLLHILIIDACLLALPYLSDVSRIKVIPVVLVVTALCVTISAIAYALIERRLTILLNRIGRARLKDTRVAEVQ